MKFLISTLLHKYYSLPIATKATIAFLFASLFQNGLGFLMSPIYVRILSSEQYGIVSVYASYEMFLTIIAGFCLACGSFDVAMQDYKNDRSTYLFSILILSNVITLSTGFFIAIFIYFVSPNLPFPHILIFFMILKLLMEPALVFWTRLNRYEYKYLAPMLISLITSLLSSIITVCSVLFFDEYKVEAKITSSLCVMLPLYIYFWIHLAKKSKFKINISYLKFAFFFNLPLIPHYLSCIVLSNSDRIMIGYLSGSSQVAYYSLACNISMVLTVLWSAVNSSITPFIFKNYENKNYELVSNIVLPIVAMYALICLFFCLLAPELIVFIGTEEYYDAIYVIPPIVGGVFFLALYYLFTNILYYYKKPNFVMLGSVTTACLNLVLNYIFIQKYGYIAAAYTTLFCYLFQCIIDFYIAKQIIGFYIYNTKFLCLLSLVMLILIFISSYLYSFSYIRWCAIILIALFVYKERYVFFKIKS